MIRSKRPMVWAALRAVAQAGEPAAVAPAPVAPVAPKAAPELPKPPPPPPIPATLDPAIAERFTRLRTPQESMAAIQLPPGYHLQLIAAEPDIISPVCMAWDGDGAMYVCEMRTYMLDIDGGKTMEPKSR